MDNIETRSEGPDPREHDWRRLVEDHLWLADRLARHMAKRFPRHIDNGDLHGAALLGLTEAAQRFDPSLGVPFSAFASARVKGEIIQVARSVDIAPRRLRSEMRELTATDERLTHQLGRRPTDDELGEALHVDRSTVIERRAHLERSSVTSLELDSVKFALPVGERDEPADSVARREELGTLREAVDRLPEPLRTITVRLHWHGDRLIDIAADMHVSFQRIAQYKLEALRTLATWMAMIDETVASPGDGLPGSTRRAAYCNDMLRNSTWLSRLNRGDDGEMPLSATG
jgi:RNA polymerase sigma factor FliA